MHITVHVDSVSSICQWYNYTANWELTLPSKNALLRTYPPRFGRVLQRLHPRLIKERTVDWNMPADLMERNLEEFFDSLPWGDMWHDGDMISVLSYLRGSYNLHLGHWRSYFPTKMWTETHRINSNHIVQCVWQFEFKLNHWSFIECNAAAFASNLQYDVCTWRKMNLQVTMWWILGQFGEECLWKMMSKR